MYIGSSTYTCNCPPHYIIRRLPPRSEHNLASWPDKCTSGNGIPVLPFCFRLFLIPGMEQFQGGMRMRRGHPQRSSVDLVWRGRRMEMSVPSLVLMLYLLSHRCTAENGKLEE